MSSPAVSHPSTTVREPVRIALHHDYELVVQGLQSMLRPYAHRVVLVAEEGRDRGPGKGWPVDASGADLVLLDVFVPTATLGPARAVVYTWDVDAALETDATRAAGLISKALPAGDLVEALERIHRGHRVVARGPERFTRNRPVSDGTWLGCDLGLSERESEVLGHIASGISNNEVAERAFLSINTVKSYVRSTYRKIGVDTRSQAVLWAVEHGFRASNREARR